MPKKNAPEKNTALYFIQEVMTNVDMAKLNRADMLRDIKMMNFKVRPLSGDLFMLAQKHTGFLEQLWKLGKLEEIIHRAMISLNSHEQHLFFNYIDMFEQKMKEASRLEIANIPDTEEGHEHMVTLEIFKEAKKHARAN